MLKLAHINEMRDELSGWETRFESIAGVQRIEGYDLDSLRRHLGHLDDRDSYLTSPVYYAFTGRYGLWSYSYDQSTILVCWHPNVKGQVLIFCPTVIDQKSLNDLLAQMPLPEHGIRLARLKHNSLLLDPEISESHSTFIAQKTIEHVLDWKYPVHILDTQSVAALRGTKYMHIRNRIKQLKHHSIKVESCDPILHSRSMENLIHRWAQKNASNIDDYNNMYAPYEYLFSLFLETSSHLDGLLFFVDDSLEAVALWDISNRTNKSANLFANICNTKIHGLSEYLVIKSCEKLYEQNVGLLNLGGSEWEGLDHYKRKFRPIHSIDLVSADIQKSYNHTAPTHKRMFSHA